MGVVFLLLHFFPCYVQVVAVCADYVVAAVGTGVVDGFVFSHERYGDCAGETAEGARVGC